MSRFIWTKKIFVDVRSTKSSLQTAQKFQKGKNKTAWLTDSA